MSERTKIGMVTLYNNNYGSVLQGYATQHFCDSIGCECEILSLPTPMFGLEQKMHIAGGIIRRIVSSPIHTRLIVNKVKKNLSYRLPLSQKSREHILRFIHDEVAVRYCQKADYKKIDSEYDFFFSGSDQVWNGERIEFIDHYFLRFASPHKRIAWAPSIGTKEVAKYNQRAYKKYMDEFRALSVREKSGNILIRELTGKEATVLADPVCLLSKEEWLSLAKTSTIKCSSQKYVLLFFLDAPNAEVTETINNYISSLPEQVNIYTFGYNHSERFQRCTHIDGGPADFLRLISDAEIVFTDSYHATMFSVIFHKCFTVFERNYSTGGQSSRILDLLSTAGLNQCFNCIQSTQTISYEKADEYLKNCRKSAVDYLANIDDKFIGDITGKRNVKETLEIGSGVYCSACGACVSVCPVNAISFSQSEKTSLPVIDKTVCINCDRCRSVCQYISHTGQKRDTCEQYKGFIGYGRDSICMNSTSGGLFASMAVAVLNRSGVVYGAGMHRRSEGGWGCRHYRIDKADELYRVLGSKYIRSNIGEAYKKCRDDLNANKLVLFSGTSCEIEGLYRSLGRNYSNLITVDLVCHGVPKDGIFEEYMRYIEKKYKCSVVGCSFRDSSTNWKSNFEEGYRLSFECMDNKTGKVEILSIPSNRSVYYRMFMDCSGYRESCYRCKYASVAKPADITLGDFYVDNKIRARYEDVFLNMEDRRLSMMITRNPKAIDFVNSCNVSIYDISVEDIINTHKQLQSSSFPDYVAELEYSLYSKLGCEAFQKYIDKHNRMMIIPKILYKGIRKLKR